VLVLVGGLMLLERRSSSGNSEAQYG